MKKSKLLAIIICFMIVITTSFPISITAFERKEHDSYMTDVLFKNFLNINNSKYSDEIDALCCASYLVIDQFNGSGQNDLDKLNKYKVKNIPTSVSSISFNASGKTHRSYTHRGWDSTNNMYTNWINSDRRRILINTVDTIFDFKGDNKKRDSFCALIYYIHLIGDHMDDTSYKSDNGLKIEMGGRIDKETIIDELLKNLEILFSEQKNSHKYTSFSSALQRYNSKYSELIRSEGGVNSEEKFRKKQELNEKVLKLLTMYIPEMLKDEEFFNEVFY